MKRIVCVAVLLLTLVVVVKAQEQEKLRLSYSFGPVECRYDNLVKYYEESFNVKIVKPKDFEGVRQYVAFISQEPNEPGIMHIQEYNVIFASKAGDCFVMLNDLWWAYDLFSGTGKTGLKPRNQAINTYNLLANLKSVKDNASVDTAEIAKHITTLDAKQFNADEAMMLKDVPMKNVAGLGSGYKTCAEIYIKQQGKPKLEVTVVFKDMDEAKKQAYLAEICRSISYGKTNWKYDGSVASAARKKYGFE